MKQSALRILLMIPWQASSLFPDHNCTCIRNRITAVEFPFLHHGPKSFGRLVIVHQLAGINHLRVMLVMTGLAVDQTADLHLQQTPTWVHVPQMSCCTLRSFPQLAQHSFDHCYFS